MMKLKLPAMNNNMLNALKCIVEKAALIFGFAVNVLCLLIWMECIARDNYSLTLIWLLEQTHYAALCAGLIALVLSVLILIFGRMAAALAVGNTFFLCVSLIQHFKLLFRGDPLQFSDLYLIREALAVTSSLLSADILLTKNILLGVALLVVIIPTAHIGVRILPKRPRLRMMLAAALCAVIFPYLGLMARTQADHLMVVEDDYTKRGLLVAFVDRFPCFSDVKSGLPEPEDYHQEAIVQVLEAHKGANSVPDVLPDVLFIMSESLFDISKEYQLSEEPMPFFKQLQREHFGGDFLTASYGGGTANVEYEVLTGYRTKDIPGFGFDLTGGTIQPGMKTILSVLDEHNYYTEAIHPNVGNYYDRQNVYAAMGFDDAHFINKLDPMPKTVLLHPPDDYLYEQIIRIYENRPKDQPWFCHTVTFQNHAGYGFDADFDAVHVESKLDEPAMKNVHNFSNMLRLSDEALRELVDYFEGQSRPVVIVMWGDHAPAVNQFGLSMPSGEKEQMRYHSTPLLIYSNYDLDTSFLPEQISAYRLGAYALRLLGMDSDAYFNYISSDDALNMTHFRGLIAENGEFVSAPERYLQEDKTLLMLHYDRLNGENYGEGL